MPDDDMATRPVPSAEPGSSVATLGPEDLPSRVRMPLLTLITQQSLDEDYLLAAERKAAGAPLAPRRRPHRVAAVVVALFGMLVATAFVQTSRNAGVDDAGRASLTQRIETQRDRLAQQQTRVADAARGATPRSRPRPAHSSTASRPRWCATGGSRCARGSSPSPVRESGSPSPTGPTPTATSEMHDADLELLVNGLWEAGAEAVAVNDQRITTLTAIRKSGDAIRVNGVGITGPYVVEAIGDTRTLSGAAVRHRDRAVLRGCRRFLRFHLRRGQCRQPETPGRTPRRTAAALGIHRPGCPR